MFLAYQMASDTFLLESPDRDREELAENLGADLIEIISDMVLRAANQTECSVVWPSCVSRIG